MKETVIWAYLQHTYATVSGYLTLVTDNGEECINDLFWEVTQELGSEHQFTSPYHPQSNEVLEKIPLFLKTCIRKHRHKKLDWEDIIQLLLFSFRMIPCIYSR